MLIESEFLCAWCGQPNWVSIDPTGGKLQNYTEDCQTCCRPNLLYIEIDPNDCTARLEALPESDLES